MATVFVPAGRLSRWLHNFTASHGAVELRADGGTAAAVAADGSTFRLHLPFDRRWEGATLKLSGPEDPALVTTAETLGVLLAPPDRWGLLLVRKGGFAVARMHQTSCAARKTGSRHVQGRSKAGGQSQQRFARRRDNQARDAYRAAADHAARVLSDPGSDEGLLAGLPVVAGGDRDAVALVLQDPRLAGLTVVEPWLPVPEPRAKVLDQAMTDAVSARLEVHNAPS